MVLGWVASILFRRRDAYRVVDIPSLVWGRKEENAYGVYRGDLEN